MGKKLTQPELQDRRRRDLCFKCGEHCVLDHVCKMKHYQLVLMERSDEESQDEIEVEAGEEEKELEMRTLQIPFNSLKGLTTNKSSKVMGSLERKRLSFDRYQCHQQFHFPKIG